MATNIVSQLEAGGIITAYPPRAVNIAPNDDTEFEQPLQVWVNTGGDVVVEPWRGGNTVTYKVVDGTMIPAALRRVLATGTTASGMIGHY